MFSLSYHLKKHTRRIQSHLILHSYSVNSFTQPICIAHYYFQ